VADCGHVVARNTSVPSAWPYRGKNSLFAYGDRIYRKVSAECFDVLRNERPHCPFNKVPDTRRIAGGLEPRRSKAKSQLTRQRGVRPSSWIAR